MTTSSTPPPPHSANPLLPPEELDIDQAERMWPLDLGMTALGGLVLYMVLTNFAFDDPRWLYNAWTYLILVPLITLGISATLHLIASRYVQKSVQVGFLFSTIVHLLLLILAIRWVIFPHYFPEAFAGVKPDRSPIRKTVPEYLFQKPTETKSATPDWSQPVDAETTSRVIPREERQLPPVQRSAPKLEVPQPSQPQQNAPQKFLMKRPEPVASQPKPADSPSKLARRRVQRDAPSIVSESAPEAPAVETTSVPAAEVARAEKADQPRRPKRQRSKPSMSIAAAAPDLPKVDATFSPTPAIRRLADSMPQVGTSGVARDRSQRLRTERAAPAGSAPAPPTVAVAKLDVGAERMLVPLDTPMQRRSEAVGAQISAAPADTPSPSLSSEESDSTGDLPQRNELASMAGMPQPKMEDIGRPRSARRRGRGGQGEAAGQAPDVGAIAEMMADAADSDGEAGDDDEELSAMAKRELDVERSSSSAESDLPELSASADPVFELDAPDGPVGLAKMFTEKAGMVPSEEPVEMASMDMKRDPRPRREVGGPVTPAGMAIAAVEQFSRRVQRTNGGAAPAPAGMVGPATEEAIELGLAYLSSIQNPDGSWSLQGHGEDVLLRSDTAATGMCLLAFQGAGYTHRQHQYAAVVAKGLEFLVRNQKTNGDLYRLENPVSDANVALYSHGIAALAMSEAYGMTQDSELREPAQMCLNYIEATQHSRRGGWRYTPQVSSDTSVTGWMMMALKSGDLSGLEVSTDTYKGIERWLGLAKVSPTRRDLYVYNPFAPNTPEQAHGRKATPTMTAVGILMRMYTGWSRDNPDMQSAAEYILKYPPSVGTRRVPERDTYYWYYATQVMFHMGGDYWDRWNRYLNPVLIDSQIKRGPEAGSWDPEFPVPDRWSPHGGRLYVSAMNLLNLEVYYRHLPIYEETAGE
ncbi:Prenyltransferase and squalene oxidase repeat-containing protein [Neorhodopirellula lusitana]|uniref:Prenyltransferase and squalene oxidase repeat-containing protein n=2 Tax=Neorhodopirellula lusitana TaxID=445327 RepID=A0ABY1QGD2_9BACT|nr:Prenyltransferase and squalene oxidase repeat-containing protein [Neorhodopirellula lusitana]